MRTPISTRCTRELLSAEFSALNRHNRFLYQDFLYIQSWFFLKEDDKPFKFFDSKIFLSSWKLHEGLFFIPIPEEYHNFVGFNFFFSREKGKCWIYSDFLLYHVFFFNTFKDFKVLQLSKLIVAQSINCYQSSFNTLTCINYIPIKNDSELMKTRKECGQDRLQALSMNRVHFSLFLKHKRHKSHVRTMFDNYYLTHD